MPTSAQWGWRDPAPYTAFPMHRLGSALPAHIQEVTLDPVTDTPHLDTLFCCSFISFIILDIEGLFDTTFWSYQS